MIKKKLYDFLKAKINFLKKSNNISYRTLKNVSRIK